MRVLILGGTVFLSRAVAQEYLERGHDVTCLSRRGPENSPTHSRAVVADRSTGVDAYDEVRADWDVVVDVATDPRFVSDALSVLAERTRHWIYVSSCSVYADQNEPGCDESRATFAPLAADVATRPDNYGESKAAGEAACRDTLADRLFVVRPGLIVGANDPSDRAGYWPARFARGDDDVLVPEAKGLRAQMIDVRDLAHWMVTSAEVATTGVFNAVGDSRPLSDVLGEVRRVAGYPGDVVVAPDQWLLDHDVSPWAGSESLPLWIPLGRGFDGFARRPNDLARRSGLRLRPLDETLLSVLEFERSEGLERDRRAGLSAARESELRQLLVRGG